MYRPSEIEQALIDRAVAVVRQAVEELDLRSAELARASKDWLSFEQPPPAEVYAPLAARLEKEFPPERLPWTLADPALAAHLGMEAPVEQVPSALAAVLAHPEAVSPAYDQAAESPAEIGLVERLTIVVAVQWSIEHFSAAAAGSLGTRLRHFFSKYDDSAAYRRRGLPGIESYLEIVHRVGDHPEAVHLLKDLVTGQHGGSLKFPWVDRGPILWRVTY